MKGYDPACEDLAEMFLEDPPQQALLVARGYDVNQRDDLRRRLAQHIQESIEDWFATLDDENEAKERAQAEQRAAHDDGEGHGDPAHHR